MSKGVRNISARSLFRLNFGTHVKPTRLTLGYLQLKPLSSIVGEAVKELDLTQGAVVIDLGCGDQPYRELFDTRVLYLGLDFPTLKTTGSLTVSDIVFGDVEAAPIRQGCVDLVLCTQVLEHVENPSAVISEIERILKDEGVVILSTHGVFPVHACPNDLWRWTDSGLRKMFEGFDNVRVISANTTLGTFAYLLEDQIGHRFSSPASSVKSVCRLALRWVVNVLGDAAQRIRPSDSGKRPLIGVYVVVARRKRGAGTMSRGRQ